MPNADGCSTSGADRHRDAGMSGRVGRCRKVLPAHPPPTERARVPELLLTISLIALGWFLLIRPQQARVRSQRAMVAALAVGDRVITAGGIHGRINALAVETVELEVAPGVVVTLARAAVMRRRDDDPAASPASDAAADTGPVVITDSPPERATAPGRGTESGRPGPDQTQGDPS